MIIGGTSIINSNVITDVFRDSSKMIIKSDYFTLNHLKSKTLVIASQTEPFLIFDRNVRSSSEIGDNRPDHGRIVTLFVNKKIWSRDENFSVQSDVGKSNKLDTSVQQSLKKKVWKVSSLKLSRSRNRPNG